jgi:hypothetical protein
LNIFRNVETHLFLCHSIICHFSVCAYLEDSGTLSIQFDPMHWIHQWSHISKHRFPKESFVSTRYILFSHHQCTIGIGLYTEICKCSVRPVIFNSKFFRKMLPKSSYVPLISKHLYFRKILTMVIYFLRSYSFNDPISLDPSPVFYPLQIHFRPRYSTSDISKGKLLK